MVITTPKSKSISSLFPPVTDKPSGSGWTPEIEQPKKRQREDIEVTPPPLITVEDTTNIHHNNAVSMLSTPNSIKAKGLAVRLDRLHDKKARYASHKEFLQKCIAEKLVPNGLKLELEATIGNHDDEFLANWNERLNSFSLMMMGDIVKFCDKTTLEVEANIETTSNLLSLEIKGDELKTVKTTIESNYDNQKRILNAGKTKKFRQLKFYPNRSTARNFDNNDDNNKKNYSQVVKSTQLGNNRQKVVSPRNSSTNLAKKNSNIHLSGTGNI